jgi:hypothetical protein
MSDAADIADADAFQDLGQNTDFFSELAPDTDQPAIGDLPGVHDHEEVQANQQEVGNAETMPAVVIDYFPSGWAGAPITSMACGTSIYKSCQDTHANSEWALLSLPGGSNARINSSCRDELSQRDLEGDRCEVP